jgi:nucleotide-binding universal stress UspA family protein
MYKYKNILVPTDFSTGAENSLTHATEIAKSMNARIHLLNVVQTVVYPIGIEIAHESLLNLEQELEENSRTKLEQICAKLSSDGIDNVYKVILGKAHKVIIDYANENEIDLTVIATHGSSGFEHFLFGSTTEKVIRKINSPILVVHYPKD